MEALLDLLARLTGAFVNQPNELVRVAFGLLELIVG
jgi:hypothetical protein